MSVTDLTEKELRLTAALYARTGDILEHVERTGKLPDTIKAGGGMAIGMRVVIQERGTDITLTEKEQKVYDAIVREGRLPGGAVRLAE